VKSSKKIKLIGFFSDLLQLIDILLVSLELFFEESEQILTESQPFFVINFQLIQFVLSALDRPSWSMKLS